jgi:hypothetical protein
MELAQYWGYLLFFAVPILLWLIGALAVKRRPLIVRLLSVIAGDDNRLSLSRAQAFAWTLVIFGSFAAAMAVHSHIGVGTTLEMRQRIDAAKQLLQEEDADLKTADVNSTNAKKNLDAATTAWTNAEENATKSRILVAGTGEAEKAAAQKKAADDQKSADALKNQKDDLDKLYKNTVSARDQAQTARDKAEVDLSANSADWVRIPNALLALAGIAIGSGVFSSLIAGLNSEGKTAFVTSLSVVTPEALKARFGDVNAQASPQPMVIEGANFGSTGRVRTEKLVLPVLFWSNDGKAISVDISNVKAKTLNDIVIETANGKLAYYVTGDLVKPVLGLPLFIYDLADLFRDDKNPGVFSLMKFQMFGWTVVAIIIYSWIFLTNLGPHMSSLPAVDQSIVLLTGLSQGGYLAGKAVSSVGK